MFLIRAVLIVCALAIGFPTVGTAETWTLRDAFMPEGISLTLAHRTRYELLDDPFRTANRGKSLTDVVAMRTLLHARVDLPAGLTVGAELMDSRAFRNRDTVLNSTTVNPAELLQAYLEFEGAVAAGDLLLRAGRITLDVGSRRFVARNRYRNTINGFTGLDFNWQGGPGRDNLNLRAFATLPVQREPNPQSGSARRNRFRDNDVVFDTESFDVGFWGLFAARDFDVLGNDRPLRGEVFLFGLHESDDADRPTRNRQIYTPGFRVFTKPAKGHFDATVEGAIQVGESRSSSNPASAASRQELDHLAWFVHGTLGFTFDVPWSPRLAFQFDYASGDDDPGDDQNNRFDTLFGARRFDFGPTGIYGPFARANLISPGLRLQVKPGKSVSSFVAARTFWIADRRDGWTTSGVRDAQGDSGNHVGTQIEIRIRWDIFPKNVRLEAGYAHLFVGEYISRANPISSNTNAQGDSEYVYTQAVLNF